MAIKGVEVEDVVEDGLGNDLEVLVMIIIGNLDKVLYFTVDILREVTVHVLIIRRRKVENVFIDFIVKAVHPIVLEGLFKVPDDFDIEAI